MLKQILLSFSILIPTHIYAEGNVSLFAGCGSLTPINQPQVSFNLSTEILSLDMVGQMNMFSMHTPERSCFARITLPAKPGFSYGIAKVRYLGSYQFFDTERRTLNLRVPMWLVSGSNFRDQNINQQNFILPISGSGTFQKEARLNIPYVHQCNSELVLWQDIIMNINIPKNEQGLQKVSVSKIEYDMELVPCSWSPSQGGFEE